MARGEADTVVFDASRFSKMICIEGHSDDVASASSAQKADEKGSDSASDATIHGDLPRALRHSCIWWGSMPLGMEASLLCAEAYETVDHLLIPDLWVEEEAPGS